jgi:hypothetical protein
MADAEAWSKRVEEWRASELYAYWRAARSVLPSAHAAERASRRYI